MAYPDIRLGKIGNCRFPCEAAVSCPRVGSFERLECLGEPTSNARRFPCKAARAGTQTPQNSALRGLKESDADEHADCDHEQAETWP